MRANREVQGIGADSQLDLVTALFSTGDELNLGPGEMLADETGEEWPARELHQRWIDHSFRFLRVPSTAEVTTVQPKEVPVWERPYTEPEEQEEEVVEQQLVGVCWVRYEELLLVNLLREVE